MRSRGYDRDRDRGDRYDDRRGGGYDDRRGYGGPRRRMRSRSFDRGMGRRSRSPSGGRNDRYGGRPRYRDGGGNRDDSYHRHDGRRDRDYSGDRRGGPGDEHPVNDRADDYRGNVPASGEFMFNDRGPPRGDGGGYRRGPPRDGRDGGGFRDGYSHRNEEKDRIRREGLCFICKTKGHMAKDCPNNSGQRGPDRSGDGGYQRRPYADERD